MTDNQKYKDCMRLKQAGNGRPVVVQLDPEKVSHPALAAHFMIVEEIKNWGVTGYVQSFGRSVEGLVMMKDTGQIFLRQPWDSFELVGLGVWEIGGAANDAEAET